MKRISSLMLALVSVLSLTYFASCKKNIEVTATTTDVNIYDYLKKNPDKFSEFVKIIDKAGYSDFLNAYGSYTLFAPDNNGVLDYMKQLNKTVDALTEAEAQSIAKLHLIQDTINTNQFKDGKLPQITMYGQYLLTGVINKAGTSSFIINREAVVTEPNIRLANGEVHVIDHVLKPATKSLSQLVEQDPKYSIFTDALKATGFYDALNIVNNPDTTKRWLTLLAEPNKALQDSGITSFAALKAKYSQTGNPKDPTDSLYLYVAYHVLYDAKYIADIVSASSHNTLAPLEVITQTLQGETVLLNDLTFEKEGITVHEQGVSLDRATSDIAATNGVLHTTTAHFMLKTRQPYRVDFDVADQPELRKLSAVFRKSTPAAGTASGTGGFAMPLGSFKDITWDPSATQSVGYVFAGTASTTWYTWYGDFLELPIGLTNGARAKWFEFRTPLIVKGRYKVWVCYKQRKQSNNNPPFPLRSILKQKLPTKDSITVFSRLFDFEEAVPTGTTGELEALGWKIYAADAPTNTTMAGRLVGIVDVQITDRQIFRIEALTGGGQSLNDLDIIQFIPITSPQTTPTFKRDGTRVF